MQSIRNRSTQMSRPVPPCMRAIVCLGFQQMPNLKMDMRTSANRGVRRLIIDCYFVLLSDAGWMFTVCYPISAKANCSAHFSALANEKYRTGMSYFLASVMIL